MPKWWETWLPLLLLPLLVILFFVFQRRAQGQMGNIMSIGRSKAKTYSTERPGTTFADVAGYEGVKTEIREVVDFLKYPEKFSQIGARIPKGVLMVGPPGTGKTLLAKAIAGEAKVPFFTISGSDFVEMFVGVGASRVRDMFDQAKKHAPCIIFIDEIDAVGRHRGAGLGGGHDEREQTLNQLLVEMDGFEMNDGIIVIAATNRPDVLDPALLRPGRFDRQVVVPLPEHDERLAILRVHAKSKRISPEVDLAVVARGTPGMSGADLANLVNEAALHAVRRGGEMITRDDFEYARDRVLMGQRRESMALSEKEKELTAYHEAGHAVAATLLEEADPVHKVTILPMGMALGVTQQLPQEDKHSYSQQYLDDSIVVAMGGRIAERLVFGVVSSRREQRPGRLHRAGPQDGPRVGHVRPRGAHGLGLAGPGVPRRGPDGQRPRLLRRDRSRHRRGGREDPPRLRAALRGPAHRAPQRPRPRGPQPARARDPRRRRGAAPARPRPPGAQPRARPGASRPRRLTARPRGDPPVRSVGRRRSVVGAALGHRAGFAQFGEGRPQVRRRRLTDERPAHSTVGVGDQHHRYGVDPVAVV